jgi:hypothetical protein
MSFVTDYFYYYGGAKKTKRARNPEPVKAEESAGRRLLRAIVSQENASKPKRVILNEKRDT